MKLTKFVAAFVIAVFCCSPSFADQIYPREPKLINGDPVACSAILSGLQTAFKAIDVPNFTAASLERSGPLKVSWGRENRSEKWRIDFDVNGQTYTLIHHEEEVRFLHYNLYEKIYLKDEYEKAIKKDNQDWLSQNGSLVAPKRHFDTDARPSASDYVIWNNILYLIEDGHRFPHSPIKHGKDATNLTLHKVNIDGSLDTACVIQAFPAIKRETIKSNHPNLGEFVDALDTMGGQGCFTWWAWDGAYKNRAISLDATLYRPFQNYDKSNHRISYKSHLESWAQVEENLSNWSLRNNRTRTLWNTYHSAKPQAEEELAVYYKLAFRMDEKTANEHASKNLKKLVLSYIGDYALSAYNDSDYAKWKDDRAYKKNQMLVEALPDLDALELLLEAGFPIDSPNAFHKTPLMFAAHYNHADAVTFLLLNGADIKQKTITFSDCRDGIDVTIGGRTALMYAAENASQSLVNTLIRFGADINAVDSSRRTVKDYAAFNETKITIQPKSKIGPSFDCSTATRRIDLAICYYDYAALQDMELGKKYSDLLNSLEETSKRKLIQSHREWVKTRDKECLEDPKDTEIQTMNSMGWCLGNKTEKRIAAIEKQNF